MKSALIYGDGIGYEIVNAAISVLESTNVRIDWIEVPAGLESLEKYGELVPECTLNTIRENKLALKGPFTTPSGGNQISPNKIIRLGLELFACVRPIQSIDGTIDFIVIRENTEDVYAGIEWMYTKDVAHTLKIATSQGCERFARFVMEISKKINRKKVTIVHKANNLKKTEGMFLDISKRIGALYTDLIVNDMLVDTAAYTLASNPREFDIIMTNHTYGDILSSMGAVYMGGLGVAPSASYGENLLVVEATHGSAPELKNLGVANPMAMILAGATLIESQGYNKEAIAIRKSVFESIKEQCVTPDMGGKSSSQEVTKEINRKVKSTLKREF